MLVRCVRTALAAGRSFSAASTTEVAVKRNVTGTSTNTGAGDSIGRRLLSLIYPKRSAVVTIRKWMEEGKTVRKYELNRVVRELRKLKRYKHALELELAKTLIDKEANTKCRFRKFGDLTSASLKMICEWMTVQQEIKLLPGDYAVHLDLVAKVRGFSSAEKFFEDLPNQMKGQPTCSALLHTYVQNKSSEKAEALMIKMTECGFLKNPLPYNHMLSLYISIGQVEKVPGVIQELKKNTSPDVVTYNLWLTVCASQNDIEGAEKVFLELKKAKIDADWVTYSILTSLYIKNSRLEKASSTLKEMEKRVSRKYRVGYSSLVSLHTNIGDKDGVYRIWNKIKSTFRKMNDAEYTCIIAALVKLEEFEEAENVYTEWESVSSTRDTRIPNLLLGAYINKDQMEKVENFYERMVQRGIPPSYTTWELLTWGYLKNRQLEKVLDCFKKAIESVIKWDPNDHMVREVFSGLEEQGDVEGAEKLLVTLRNAGHVTTQIYNSLWRTYAKAGKMPLIVAERMMKDKVQLNEETRQLIISTGKLCVGEVSSILS
ncbi:hypothetical protein HHK36_026711 [Tetracentron sinense]|uniref:Pentatricopeptide repeat-containing protein n=1 Tax=Tetracentron sinense TaxID=13715 RepID=A0A834YHC9_TETSI|nr:hypothetical protein HHK36_026711 [Tetracentron sinense]